MGYRYSQWFNLHGAACWLITFIILWLQSQCGVLYTVWPQLCDVSLQIKRGKTGKVHRVVVRTDDGECVERGSRRRERSASLPLLVCVCFNMPPLCPKRVRGAAHTCDTCVLLPPVSPLLHPIMSLHCPKIAAMLWAQTQRRTAVLWIHQIPKLWVKIKKKTKKKGELLFFLFFFFPFSFFLERVGTRCQSWTEGGFVRKRLLSFFQHEAFHNVAPVCVCVRGEDTEMEEGGGWRRGSDSC